MRRICSVFLMVGAAACSSAPDVQPQTPGLEAEAPRELPYNTGGSMNLQGMPALEAAELVHWQGATDVLQGVDGGKDTLEMSLGALDTTGKIQGGVYITKQIDPLAGLSLAGEYQLSEMGLHGRPYEVSVVMDGATYRSISGRVTLSHAVGKVSGTFDAQLVRDGDDAAAPISLSGSFEGRMGLTCHALRPATPDPNALGGEGEIDGRAPAGPTWVPVNAMHEFCRKYI